MSLLRLFTTAGAAGVLAIGCGGCHSAFVEADIHNGTTQPISLVEVDYPSASFGTQALGPGQTFHYRFKVLGSGAATLLWTDAAHAEHTLHGPALTDGDEGRLRIEFTPAGPRFENQISHRRR